LLLDTHQVILNLVSSFVILTVSEVDKENCDTATTVEASEASGLTVERKVPDSTSKLITAIMDQHKAIFGAQDLLAVISAHESNSLCSTVRSRNVDSIAEAICKSTVLMPAVLRKVQQQVAAEVGQLRARKLNYVSCFNQFYVFACLIFFQ